MALIKMSIAEEIKITLNSGKARYHSVQDFCFPSNVCEYKYKNRKRCYFASYFV